MNESPLISVIVPVYGVEAYLDRCVTSVLAQDLRDFELILVDDGSPDRCGEMCEAWAKKDARIRVFHQSNGGLSSARNLGLDMAKGEYLSFIDSDDWVTADYLSYLYALIREEPGCKMAACNHTVLRRGKGKPACGIGQTHRLLTREEAFEDVLFHGCIDVSAWAKLYSRGVFADLRYPNGRLFEDTWLFGDILNRTERVIFGGKSCYFYEMHEGSTVNRGFREKNLEYIEAAEKLARDAKSAGLSDEVGGTRRINHARLSVLRYMEHCEKKYKPLRQELRSAVLADAPAYISDPRTPGRDRAAVALLRMGMGPFYIGWRLYSRLRP